MEIGVGQDGELVLKKVYNSIVLETSEGNRFAICMRDDTVEMKVCQPIGKDRWYIANMQTGEIVEEKCSITGITGGLTNGNANF